VFDRNKELLRLIRINSNHQLLHLQISTFCNKFSCDGGGGNQTDIAFRGVGESDDFSLGAVIWASDRTIAGADSNSKLPNCQIAGPGRQVGHVAFSDRGY
jgi:hypothetical protein